MHIYLHIDSVNDIIVKLYCDAVSISVDYDDNGQTELRLYYNFVYFTAIMDTDQVIF